MKVFAVNIPVEKWVTTRRGISYICNPRDLFELCIFVSLTFSNSEVKEDKHLKRIYGLLASQDW